MFPTNMSLRCSVSPVALLIAKMAAADAIAYEMPMNASSGMRRRFERTREKISAPRNVNARLIQYAPEPCGSMPARIAMVAPNAAICASARSTKMTPRSTTCTPRYAWMPVRIKLARNGSNRNCKISIRSPRSFLGSYAARLLRRLERLGEQRNIVIEQLEIVGNRRLPAHRGQYHHDLPTGLARNRVRRLQIEVWLHQDQLHAVALHLLDQFDGVRRARRNAGARLHVPRHVQPEVLGK